MTVCARAASSLSSRRRVGASGPQSGTFIVGISGGRAASVGGGVAGPAGKSSGGRDGAGSRADRRQRGPTRVITISSSSPQASAAD